MSSQRGGRPVAARRCLSMQRCTASVHSAKASSTTLAFIRTTCRVKSVAPCVEPARRQVRRHGSLLTEAAEHCRRTQCLSQLTKLVSARITCRAKSAALYVESARWQSCRCALPLFKAQRSIASVRSANAGLAPARIMR